MAPQRARHSLFKDVPERQGLLCTVNADVTSIVQHAHALQQAVGFTFSRTCLCVEQGPGRQPPWQQPLMEPPQQRSSTAGQKRCSALETCQALTLPSWPRLNSCVVVWHMHADNFQMKTCKVYSVQSENLHSQCWIGGPQCASDGSSASGRTPSAPWHPPASQGEAHAPAGRQKIACCLYAQGHGTTS